MINKPIDPDSLENDPKPERFFDEKTENKVHQHLSDASDLISDEDIKEVRTDVGVTAEPSQGFSEEELKNPEKEEEQLKKKGDEDDHSIISSWNILDI